jgi:hypothetical protein
MASFWKSAKKWQNFQIKASNPEKERMDKLSRQG